MGIDPGIKNLATLSTGEIIEGAKSNRKYEAKLSRLQWLNRHIDRDLNAALNLKNYSYITVS